METLGLYLHVPFCRSKCAYCDFYSLPREEGRIPAYVDALCARISRWGPRAAGLPVDTVYLGGGTPSLLGPVGVHRVLAAVREHFSLLPGAEVTLECNPDSADAALLAGAREAGVTRLSLGVQTAQDALLRRLGRPHTFADAVAAVGRARAAGFDNVSLDLICGLPGETEGSLTETLDRVLALSPEHLSVYGLKVEPGTPLWHQVQAGTARLPDEDTQADRYLRVCRTLARAGYDQYEISNFARPGFESRHNLRYWRLQPYLGLGPGAHSDFAGRRFAWARDLDAFLRGEDLLEEDAAIPPEERERERVMLGLRTREGIDPARVPEDLAARLVQAGLAQMEKGRFRLTAQGFLVSNAVILRLLDQETPHTS